MRKAAEKREKAEREDAVEEQEEARRELEQAAADLERILRQLREEEVERMLALARNPSGARATPEKELPR